jgi:hypothetical protein
VHPGHKLTGLKKKKKKKYPHTKYITVNQW